MTNVNTYPIEVVAITDPADLHWTVVAEQLDLMGSTIFRFNLSDMRRIGFTASIGNLSLQASDRRYLVSSRTSVWWRRPGTIDFSGLDDEEARLAFDEGPQLLIGALDATNARLVDHPLNIARAEVKPLQLSIAQKLGIAIPATQITNDPNAARVFASGRKIVAKAVSSGIGIAPYVAEIIDSELEALKMLPTMLQELIPASADLRVIVVDKESWVWRRPRETGTVDWRQVDPHGNKFHLAANEQLGVLARRISYGLGLSMSVQDWLETENGPVFLESNAQGSWLFLPGSRPLVAPAIARCLRANT